MLRPLGKSKPGIEYDPVPSDTRRQRCCRGWFELSDDLSHHVAVAGIQIAGHVPHVTTRVHEYKRAARGRAHVRDTPVEPKGGYVVDYRRAGRNSRICDVGFYCIHRDA